MTDQSTTIKINIILHTEIITNKYIRTYKERESIKWQTKKSYTVLFDMYSIYHYHPCTSIHHTEFYRYSMIHSPAYIYCTPNIYYIDKKMNRLHNVILTILKMKITT